jgi:ligand-binding sensor domain-containing protein/signal transduction histidine kinase
MKRIAIFSMLIITFLSAVISSQSDNKRFITLPLTEGIALNQTYDMVQDSKGFIWFGTLYGLVRYDGKEYKVYQNDRNDSTSISFNDIISLYCDKKGNLWIGTWGGGLNCLPKNSEKFKRYVYDPENYMGISDNIIWAITEDENGNIWVATGTGKLNMLHKNTNKFKRIDIFSDSLFNNKRVNVNSLYYENQYSIWIGHNYGLTRYDPQANKAENYKLKIENQERAYIPVQSIQKDELNTLWVGTVSGLFSFNQTENKFYNVESTKNFAVHSIYPETGGKLWCGTNNGILIYTPETDKKELITSEYSNSSIPGNFVKKIFKDKSSVLWFDCYQSGIAKYHPEYNRFTNYSFPFNKLKSLTEDKDGNIYAAIAGEGVFRLNNDSQKFEKLNIENNSINFLSSINYYDGKLLLSIPGSLIVYDLKSKKIIKDYFPGYLLETLQQKQVNSLIVSQDSSYWIGTYANGVFVFNTNKDTLIQITPSLNSENKSSDYILTLYEDNQNRIWVGSYGGVFCYNQKTELLKSFINYSDSVKSISNNYVYSIFQDSKSNIWIGTACGLNKITTLEGNFTQYYSSDGLANDVINGILEDNSGNIWLSTNKGISRFNPQKNDFLNFSKADGLQSDIFFSGTCLKSADGRMFFAGLNGLTSFDSNNFPVENYSAPVSLASVEMIDQDGVFHRLDLSADKNEFGHNENSFRFQISAFDFRNPDNIKYKYKIKNFADDWINLGNKNSFTVSNLSPGNYELIFSSTNSDGIWSPVNAGFKFSIDSPFWTTWWFWLILLFSLLIMILSTYRLTLYLKVQKELEINRIKKEESDKVRKQTAIDFHDDLGHRLTRISLLTEIIKRKLKFTFSEISPLLDQISDNSARLYDGTKDFIWAIDPKKDSLYELMIRLKDFGDEIYNDTNVKFWVNEPDENLMTAHIDMEWKRHLMLIFKEGINNSIKHSNSTLVILDTKLNRDEFEILLEDNGRGFRTDEIKPGNGLKNMKNRAESLHLHLNVDSEPGKGTRISVKGKFPVKSLNFN